MCSFRPDEDRLREFMAQSETIMRLNDTEERKGFRDVCLLKKTTKVYFEFNKFLVHFSGYFSTQPITLLGSVGWGRPVDLSFFI